MGLHHLGPDQCQACLDRDEHQFDRPDQRCVRVPRGDRGQCCADRAGVKNDTVVDTNKVQLSGTAEGGSLVKIFDGANIVGSGTAGANGSWSITTGALSNGLMI